MLYIEVDLCLKQVKHIFNYVIFQLISFFVLQKT